MSSSGSSGLDIVFDDEETFTGLDSTENQNVMITEVSSPLFSEFKQWARSGDVDDNNDKMKEGLVETFRFYLLDCDSWTCRTSKLEIFENPGRKRKRGDCNEGAQASGDCLESVMRLYGVDKNGKSVCCIVRGFLPAFYARTSKQMEDSEVQLLLGQLNEAILKMLENSKSCASFVKSQKPAILKIEKLDSCSGVLGVDGQRERGLLEGSLLKITCSLTMLVREAAKVLTAQVVDGSSFAGYEFKVFENYLKPAVRYMATQGVPCCSWIDVNQAVVVASQQNEGLRISYTDLILCSDYQNIRALSADDEPQEIPKLRVLSMDIEIFDPALYADPKAKFPKPGRKDVKIVQIGNILRTLGDRGGGGSDLQVMFALNTCDPIEHAQVFKFHSEEELLRAWRLFVVLVDPDILTGYNVHNFDITFLLERAKVLGLTNFPYFGKCVSTAMSYQNVPSGRAQKALHFINDDADYIAKFSGRLVFDMITIVRKEYPEERTTGGWKLDKASHKLLNEEKLEVEYWEIPHLQVDGGAASRCRLAKYCLQDAMLAIKLMLNLPNGKPECFFDKYCKKARASGCLLRLVASRSDAYLDGIVALRAVKKGTTVREKSPQGVYFKTTRSLLPGFRAFRHNSLHKKM